jgi:hypothetical protein
MPIIFALGARLENLPLRDFQLNATKIANALRQIRSVLKVDGLACYFDPYLEAEALGCKREWNAHGSSGIVCPRFSDADDLRKKLNALDTLADDGHLRVACEVLRRLRIMLKDEPALMVSVAGPLTLAAQLVEAKGAMNAPSSAAPQDLVEFAAEVTASVSKILVESGADVVFLREVLPEISSEMEGWWASLIEPTINLVRFYEALPVLVLNVSGISERGRAAVFSRNWECLLCPALAEVGRWASLPKSTGVGVALRPEVFGADQPSTGLIASIREMIPDQRLTLLTSIGDVSEGVDLKGFTGTLAALRETLFMDSPTV